MLKPHKIKKYSSTTKFFPSKNRFRPLRYIAGVLAIGLLVFVGIFVYKPFLNFISGKVKPSPLPEPPAIVTPENSTPLPELPITENTIEEPIVAKNIHGINLPYEIAIDDFALDEFINNLSEDINTVVVNVKNNKGEILFKTENLDAVAWEAVIENPIDISVLTQKLKENSLNLAVRMSVFSDPIAARGDIDANAVMHSSGVIWIDNTLANGGKPWTTPYSEKVQSYNRSLAKELSDYGVSLIIFDYMRFPNDPTSSATFNATEGVSKSEILNKFYNDTQSAIGKTTLSTSISLWTMEQKEGGTNIVTFGDNPMNLDILVWAVEIEDTAIDNKNLQSEIYGSNNQNKEFILITTNKENSKIISSADRQFILYS